MSDPTQPRNDEDEPGLGAGLVEAFGADREEEPLDRDLDDSSLDSADADEQAARAGAKGESPE